VIRWPLAIIVLLYLALVVYELFAIPKRSAEAVAAIHAEKLTMADVDGSNLPPAPDPKLADATVQGIDANHNGIRDDVELAIFKKYPTNTKIRAAALQYALTEGAFLISVNSVESWKAAAEENGRANLCIKGSGAPSDYSLQSWIDALTFNTPDRNLKKEQVFSYTTSYGDEPGNVCDLNT